MYYTSKHSHGRECNRLEVKWHKTKNIQWKHGTDSPIFVYIIVIDGLKSNRKEALFIFRFALHEIRDHETLIEKHFADRHPIWAEVPHIRCELRQEAEKPQILQWPKNHPNPHREHRELHDTRWRGVTFPVFRGQTAIRFQSLQFLLQGVQHSWFHNPCQGRSQQEQSNNARAEHGVHECFLIVGKFEFLCHFCQKG